MHLDISVSVTFYVASGVKASYSNPCIERIGLNKKKSVYVEYSQKEWWIFCKFKVELHTWDQHHCIFMWLGYMSELFFSIKGQFFHICIPVKCWLILELGQQLSFFIKTEKEEYSTNSLDTDHETARTGRPTNNRGPHVTEARLNLGFVKAWWSSYVSGSTY